MNRNQKPHFADYESGPDFDRARTQIATPFQYLDIDLSSAVSNAIYQLAGDFIYIDAASTGQATLELNNQYNDPAAPFMVQSGFAMNAIFKQVKLSWAAQPGKILRIMYSTGERVIPANSGLQTVSISGTPQIIVNADEYNGSYKSSTDLAGNTADAIVLPASNINGLIVVSAYWSVSGSGNTSNALIAKSSAPANVNDGDVLCSGLENRGTVTNLCLKRPIKVPAGLGIYFIASSGGGFTPTISRSCLYKLL